jgi:ATP-dependent Clp protease adaptor protein ClpS
MFQAEQCAFIVHHNGKSDVKNGSYDVLHPMKDKLTSKGLSVTID